MGGTVESSSRQEADVIRLTLEVHEGVDEPGRGRRTS